MVVTAQLDEGNGVRRGEECKEGKGIKERKRKGRERGEWLCPCLVTALLRGKSLTSLGPRLT